MTSKRWERRDERQEVRDERITRWEMRRETGSERWEVGDERRDATWEARSERCDERRRKVGDKRWETRDAHWPSCDMKLTDVEFGGRAPLVQSTRYLICRSCRALRAVAPRFRTVLRRTVLSDVVFTGRWIGWPSATTANENDVICVWSQPPHSQDADSRQAGQQEPVLWIGAAAVS